MKSDFVPFESSNQGQQGNKNTFTSDFVPFEFSKSQKIVQSAKSKILQANDYPSSIGGLTKATLSDINANTPALAPKSLNPIDWLSTGFNTVKNAVVSAGDKLSNAYDATLNPSTPQTSALDKGVAVGEATLGGVNAVLSPISGAIEGVSHIPVLGYAGDAVNKLFSVIGRGGSTLAGGAVDALPVSQATKDKIKPLAEEIGALAAQVIVGKGGADVAVKIKAKQSEITTHVAEDVKKNPPPDGGVPTAVPQAVPVQGLVDSTGLLDIRTAMTNLEKQGYSQGQVSAIMGQVIHKNNTGRFSPKEIGDVASQMAPETPLVSNATIKDNPNFRGGIKQTEAQLITPTKTVDNPVGSVDNTTPTAVSGLAQSVRDKAVEAGITNDLAHLPEFNTINRADQATRANQLIDSNIELARKVINGSENAPDGIHPIAIWRALEQKAIADKNSGMITELAQSPVTQSISRSAQDLGLLVGREASPVDAIMAINNLRETKAVKANKVKDIKQVKTAEVEKIKQEIKKVSPKKAEWGEFIKSIQC